MKVDNGINPVVSFGVQNKVECGIARNAKAFRVLYKSLYSDPIKAIVRELSSNARDSHVSAGNGNKPFLVTLPNWTSNLFSVRDYGTGMSREKIEGLYSTFFASDKEDSNDFTGFLGIGSKSPLAYTRQFNITSFYNGKKLMYTLIINEKEFPELNCFGESDTTEPNGIEVSFAVLPSDNNTFVSKCKEVYRFFKVKPTMRGGDGSFAHYIPSYLYDEPEWKYRKDDNYANAQVTMGDVAYPLAVNLLDKKWAGYDKIPLLIRFDIGDVDMTASREALEYTPKTIKAVETKLELVKAYLIGEIQNKLGKSTSYFDTCCTLRSLKNDFPYAKYYELVKNDIKLPQFTRAVRTEGQINDYVNQGKNAAGSPISVVRNFISGKRRKWVEHNFTFSNAVFVVVNDTGNEKKGQGKVQHFSNYKTKVYYVYDEQGDYKALSEAFDNPAHFIKVSQLPDPPPGSDGYGKGYIKKVRGQVNTYEVIADNAGNYNNDRVFSDTPTRLDIYQAGKEVIYGSIHRNELTNLNSNTITSAASSLGKGITIHGIKQCDIHKVEGQPGWITIQDYLKRELAAKAIALNASQYVAEKQSKDKLKMEWLWNLAKLDITDMKHLYHQIKDKYDGLGKLSNRIQAVLESCARLSVAIPTATGVDLKSLEDAFVSKYKVIKLIDNNKLYQHSDSRKILTETILAIDK